MTPSGWCATTVRQVAEVAIGKTPARNEKSYWDREKTTQNRWATIADIKRKFIGETSEHISDLGVQRSNARLVPPGTLLMSFKLTLGRAAITSRSMYTNEAIAAFYPNGLADTEYLYYLFPTLALEKSSDRAVKGRTLNKAKLRALRLALPPLTEQRKIAAILSSLDDAIEKTRAVIDQVQVVKRGLMQELLTRGLPGRHTRFKQTEIGKIPEEWAIVRIIDVADVDYGISAAVSANTDPGIGWPILTGANLTLDGQIDLFKLVYHEPPSKERFYLRKNDLLLNWRSGSPKHVGKTALFDLEGNYTYASFVLRIRSRGKLVPGFGHVLLNFMRNAEFFSKDLSQQVNFKMNAAVFREILIRLPPVDEQEKIALTAARFDSRLASEAQLLAALQNVKAALMSVLLTGELRVTPDTEVA